MNQENAQRRAGIPLYYPLVFILNIALIIALELLLVHKDPFPFTEETLAQRLPAYENCTIQRSSDKTFIGWFLVTTESGEYHVVPVCRHPLFFNRCKLLDDQIVIVPGDTAEMEIKTKSGIYSSVVLVGKEVAPMDGEPIAGEMEIRPQWSTNSSVASITYGFYFFAGLFLSLAEAFLWHKLKG